MSIMRVRFEGIAGLIMSNPVPSMDIYSDIYKALKAVGGKRKKTEADKEEQDRLTYLAGLYLNEKGEVIIPARMIKGVLVAGARKSKMGKQAQAGLYVGSDAVLDYGKKLTPEGLWKSDNYKRRDMYLVQRARIMKIKPYFKDWSFECDIVFNNELINDSDIKGILEHGELDIGFGDFRPEYGRFKYEILGIKK